MELQTKNINKTIRTRSMHEMNIRVGIAEKNGYKIVGRIMETMSGSYQALMIKEIFFKDRK